MPVGSPFSLRSMCPPCGSRLASVMLPNCSARVFATAICPSIRTRNTGCPTDTSSRSQARGRYLHRPQSFVPARSQNPIAGLGFFDLLRHPRAQFVERLHARQIDAQFRHPGIVKMQVSVVESGHHKMSAQVDDLASAALSASESQRSCPPPECGHRARQSLPPAESS